MFEKTGRKHEKRPLVLEKRERTRKKFANSRSEKRQTSGSYAVRSSVSKFISTGYLEYSIVLTHRAENKHTVCIMPSKKGGQKKRGPNALYELVEEHTAGYFWRLAYQRRSPPPPPPVSINKQT